MSRKIGDRMKTADLIARDMRRLPEKIDVSGDCWLWTGGFAADGYGIVWATRNGVGRQHRAHRWVWELLVGQIPDGFTIDHLCRVKACVNPDHLEPVTMQENTLRGYGPTAQNARQTHCQNGHPLRGRNLRRNTSGYRVCRQCERDYRANR